MNYTLIRIEKGKMMFIISYNNKVSLKKKERAERKKKQDRREGKRLR
jgi:hypothetical protein